MEVVPVDQQHLDRRALQGLHTLQPAEPAADDDDAGD
jgi:hypothetical protein